jgi:hypothetical protein
MIALSKNDDEEWELFELMQWAITHRHQDIKEDVSTYRRNVV